MQENVVLIGIVRLAGWLFVLLLCVPLAKAEQKDQHGFHVVTIDEKALKRNCNARSFTMKKKSTRRLSFLTSAAHFP